MGNIGGKTYITQLTYSIAGLNLVPDSKDTALPLTLWHLSPHGEGGWDTGCQDRGSGAPGEKQVIDWGHGRAGDHEGVRREGVLTGGSQLGLFPIWQKRKRCGGRGWGNRS